MNPLVSTLILILLALLGARITFNTDRISPGPALLLRTGTHFLFIGFALGPHALGLMTDEAVRQLFPLMALGLGWVGFHFGLQLDRKNLREFPLSFHLFAYGQAALTFVLFFGLGWLGLRVFGPLDDVRTVLLMGAAATACVSAPAGIALVSTTFLVRGNIRRLLFFVASVDALVGIAALQLTYALFRPREVVAGLETTPGLEWLVVAGGLGVVCGIIFLWLMRPKPHGEELVLFLLGICAFASGAALQFQLSPLFVCVIMGALVANLSADPQRIFAVLQRWEKPVYVVLLLLAGALLDFPTLWIVPLAIGYVAIRGGAKIVGSAAASRAVRLGFPVPKRIGLGLMPQGGISLAMAISGVLTYAGLSAGPLDAVEILFAIVVLGVVISELTGPFFTTAILRRAGEISPRVEKALADGDDHRAQEEAIRHTAPPDPETPE